MANVAWPAADKRTLIGKRIDRLDGPAKATGAAKYTYDINRPGLLFAKLLTSPYAHADIGGIDLRAAADEFAVGGDFALVEAERAGGF